MKYLDKIINRLDGWQQRHRPAAFSYAVLKKYSEDEAGYQAALITYYAFLSLFPLLLVLTTLASDLASSHPHLQSAIIRSVTNYFPVLGNQLSAHVHTLHKNGLALVAGLIFTIYGARGVADAFRHSVQNIWHVPKTQQDGFPKSLFKSLGIIVIGGGGFALASVAAGLAAAAGPGLGFRLLGVVLNLTILFWLFRFLLNISLPRHVSRRKTRSGAATAALGLVILQALGSYLLRHELKHLDALYSYFALALSLFFWLYLQSRTLLYAIEVSSVRAQHLWPRGLREASPAPRDKERER